MKIFSTFIVSLFLLTCLDPICFASPNQSDSKLSQTSSKNCKNNDAPKVIKHMENWDIIASNIGTIPMAPVFSGNNLVYFASAHPSHRVNIVTIDKKTGILQVKAEKKDDFDITVKARNLCGEAADKFNVEIDEEE